MLSSNNQYSLEDDKELMLERPIGWSSACLDSTIDYYLNCNYTDLQQEENIENHMSEVE